MCKCGKPALSAIEMVSWLVVMTERNRRKGDHRTPYGYRCPAKPETFHGTGTPESGRRNYRLQDGKVVVDFRI